MKRLTVFFLIASITVAGSKVFTLNIQYRSADEKAFFQMTLPLKVLLKFKGKVNFGSKKIEKRLESIEIEKELRKMANNPDYRMEVVANGEKLFMWLDKVKCRGRKREYRKVLIAVREKGEEKVYIRIPISFLKIFQWIDAEGRFSGEEEAVLDYLAHPGKYINCDMGDIPLLFVRSEGDEVIITLE